MRQQDRSQRRPPENPIYWRAQRRRLRLEALARDRCRFDRERKMPTLSARGSPGRVRARRNSAPRPQVFESRNRSRGAKLTAQLTRVSFLDSGTLGVKRRPKECSDSRYADLFGNKSKHLSWQLLSRQTCSSGIAQQAELDREPEPIGLGAML